MITHSELLARKAVQGRLDDFRPELERWFQDKLGGAADARLSSIESPPADSGFSSEIYVIEIERGDGLEPRRRRYVLKRQACGDRMFEGRDFGFECRIQRILSARTALPVPSILGWEDDGFTLGAPFYVMTFLEGRTPPSNPSPHEGGMLFELSAEARRRLWFSGLARLSELHREDPARMDLAFLARGDAGRSEFAANLSYWERHYQSSCGGEPLPVMVDTIVWLRQHAPAEDRLSLVWGDARIGNMLFDDRQNCVGMVDWELASIGDPLQDLAYWTYSDDHFASIAGRALPGWPVLSETLDAYEGMGIPVDRKKLAFYRIYAGYWIVCTLSRLVEIKRACGQFPVSTRVDERFTPVRFLRTELDRV